MASVLTWENCINEGTSDFIKQYKDLIGGDLLRSQVKEIVKDTEFMLERIIKKTRNLDQCLRFLSTYEMDQISMILEEIISLEKDFREWSINKNKKRNKKIREMENNLEGLSKGPVLVSFFLFLNKKNWVSLFFGNSTSQLNQTPQFHYKEWGQGPYFWIRTDLGDVKKISKQFLGASDISIHSWFKGTLAEAITVTSYKNGLLASTFLRVTIANSNNRTRLIQLNMCNDLAQKYIGHWSVNEHVEVYGHLETCTGVDENGDVSYKLTMMEKIKGRDSNRGRNKGSQLWMETDDTIHSLSKSNLGAWKAWIFAKFDKGIVTEPVSYENRSNDISCARTYLRVPRSNCANRLILLEAWSEEDKSRMKDLKTDDRVSVSGFLFPNTDVDENRNAHYKLMPRQLSFLKY